MVRGARFLAQGMTVAASIAIVGQISEAAATARLPNHWGLPRVRM